MFGRASVEDALSAAAAEVQFDWNGHVVALSSSMGGIDALVFTAGIGEHQPGIRARVAARLAWLGAELDPDANEAGSRRISTAASRVQLLVIPTDEESIIAQEAVSEEAAT